jgi:hypothetical protein
MAVQRTTGPGGRRLRYKAWPMARLAATLALCLALGCATTAPTSAAPPEPALAPASGPRDVLLRFARATRAGRWADAWPLLSERWRTTTSPGRLAADWRGAGPLAAEAADRVVALLEAGAAPEGDGDVRLLAVGAGRAARVVREPAGWRVDALE